MHTSTFDILRCPYCGGRLELVRSSFNETSGDDIVNGILGCQCCVFPVVDGIPVMHLQPNATAARELVERRRPAEARRAMFGLDAVPAIAERVDTLVASADATYRHIVEAFGEHLEGGYFLYRFGDPTFVVGHALVRAVAGTVLRGGGRAVDVCGGSGHLTRSLMDLSAPPPVLADLYFAKVWLARRFTAPGCEPVCCDGNSPMPFARGVFRFAMCSDAFMYIWTKRQFVLDMLRLIDDRSTGARAGAVMISHTHNQCTWTPSHGQPLTPDGYRNLFENEQPRVFGETGLFADVVRGGPLDLSRVDSEKTLEAEQALAVLASRHPDVFRPHPLDPPAVRPAGEFVVNPLYAAETPDGAPVMRYRLRFPSDDYEQEYGACREYLPGEVSISREHLAELRVGRVPPGAADLVRRRVVVDIPLRYGV